MRFTKRLGVTVFLFLLAGSILGYFVTSQHWFGKQQTGLPIRDTALGRLLKYDDAANEPAIKELQTPQQWLDKQPSGLPISGAELESRLKYNGNADDPAIKKFQKAFRMKLAELLCLDGDEEDCKLVVEHVVLLEDKKKVFSAMGWTEYMVFVSQIKQRMKGKWLRGGHVFDTITFASDKDVFVFHDEVWLECGEGYEAGETSITLRISFLPKDTTSTDFLITGWAVDAYPEKMLCKGMVF